MLQLGTEAQRGCKGGWNPVHGPQVPRCQQGLLIWMTWKNRGSFLPLCPSSVCSVPHQRVPPETTFTAGGLGALPARTVTIHPGPCSLPDLGSPPAPPNEAAGAS